MKNVWVIGTQKKDLIQAQRQINAAGSMRAMCMLSFDAVHKWIEVLEQEEAVSQTIPSLIIMEFRKGQEEDERILAELQNHSMLAGVPLAFMMEEITEDLEEMSYENGATLVVKKPFSKVDQLRIEKMAWQHDMTREYEGLLQKQASEIKSAKEIQHLNEQLSNRNEVLNQLFGRYFSDELVDKILTRPEAEEIGGEKRSVTVLMADLRGFTSISESLDAEALIRVLNKFFAEMMEQITRYHGTVIELLGDALLAVFGAVSHSQSQIEDGICAAIHMQNQMQEVNAFCEEAGYPRLDMGIGLHCGEVFVGNVGSEKMMRYNVIGEAVNRCSRIENYSVGGQILVSKEMVERAKSKVHTTNPLQITVKGVKKPIEIYEVFGIEGTEKCFVGKDLEQDWNTPEVPVYMKLYPIQNKIVSEQVVHGSLRRVSMQEAVVELMDSTVPEFNARMDVKMQAENEEGESIFEDVYGKWMECENGRVRIHFTHANEAFQLFIKGLGKNGVATMGADKYGFVKCKIAPVGYEDNAFWMEEHKVMLLVNRESGERQEETEYLRSFMTENDIDYVVKLSEAKGNLQMLLLSRNCRSRALEFMYYLVKDAGLAKGNEAVATGQVTLVMMEMLMQDAEVTDFASYMMNQIYLYFKECEEIESDVYAREHADEIPTYPKYRKKQNGWSVVKTLDIAKEGQHILLKSLENEAGVDLVAGPDTYIMIGKLGEVYDIQRESFEKTYAISEEKFDLFASMTEYIPAAELDDGEYINLDEYAYICNPLNATAGIYAIPFSCRTKIFSCKRNDDYFYGEAGDYMAIRVDDFEDIYVIKKGVLDSTYELVKE